MPASPTTVTPAAARMHASARLPAAGTPPGSAPDLLPARLIARPFLCLTCANVPEAGHLRTAHRGSYAGTFGPPRHRYPVRWPSPGATRPSGGYRSVGLPQQDAVVHHRGW